MMKKSDWGGVKAGSKQACPLADRKLRAAQALPCLICQRVTASELHTGQLL